ncbi:MAG: alpha/beta hydrolase [Dehalococcoidia bacterium]
MPVHPQAQQLLDVFQQMGMDGLKPADGNAATVRAMLANFPRPEGEVVGSVVAAKVTGPGGDIPVRVYTPPNVLVTRPGLVWFHGGGWVFGDLDGADNTCRALCMAADCVVVSVDYRLAPEHKFPAAADDCYAVTKWVAGNAANLRVDAKRIAVGGDSAGGNLAAVVAQLAKTQGPELSYELLVYPVTDANFATASYTANASGYLLTKVDMEWFWECYLRTPADADDPKSAPLQAASLAGLPPAIVITAEFDPLRDEGEAYAAKLSAAGVPTECVRYDGMIHGFFGNPAMDDGITALNRAAAAMRKVWSAS